MPKRTSAPSEKLRSHIVDVLQEHNIPRAAEFLNRHPRLIRRSARRIRTLLTRMRHMGLAVPSLIRRRPKLLYTTPERIAAKLDGLRARGFRNPHILANYHHTILGLSLGTIDAKLDAIAEIVGSRGAAIALVEQRPALLAYSIARIKLVARLASADGLRTLMGISTTRLADACERAASSDPNAIRAELSKLRL